MLEIQFKESNLQLVVLTFGGEGPSLQAVADLNEINPQKPFHC